jgi:hypothetical protein
MRQKILLTLLIVLIPVTYATSKWQQYQDKSTGFSVAHPETLVATKPFSSQYITGNSWSVTADTSFTAAQTPIVEFLLLNKNITTPDLGNTSVTVLWRAAVSQEPADITACYNPVNTKAQADVTTKNLTFKHFNYSDGAMMTNYTTDIYRYLTKNSCYNIEVIHVYPDVDNDARITVMLHRADREATHLLQSVQIGK